MLIVYHNNGKNASGVRVFPAFLWQKGKKLCRSQNIYKFTLAYHSKNVYNNCDHFLNGGPIMPDLVMLFVLGGMLVVMYFVMIRPQRKQEKEQNEMRNNLAVGDEITTIGGIIGKIVSIKEETCVIETSHERTKIRILKSAVSRVDVKADDAE